MHTRSFWVLDDADERLVDRLAAGLGRTPARVLAYLLLRAARADEPATTIHLRVGTQCNRTTIGDATARLESAGLVERSSVREGDSAPGRPQTTWRPTAGVDATVRRVYRTHARDLLERAAEQHAADATPATGAAGSSDDADSGPLTLALNWRPNALHAPIYAALEASWDETFDVDVDMDHCDGSRRALERLAGEADVAVAGAATVARARAAGESVVPVAVCYQRAMTVLYTVREAFGEPLTSVAQLEGRRIGMPPSSETRLLGRLFLSQTEFGDDVRIVDTNGEERAALRHGEADVVTGSFADPRDLERRGASVDTLELTDHFPIYGPTIVVREATLADRPPALEAFLAAATAGWAEARRDARPAAERIAALADVDESADRVRDTFDRAAAAFGHSDAVDERGWGWQREPMWDRLRTALNQAALLDPA